MTLGKWRALVLVAAVAFLAALGPAAQAGAAAPPAVTVMVGQTALRPDPPARVVDGRVLVPLRALGEALGAEVHWERCSRGASFGTTPVDSRHGTLNDMSGNDSGWCARVEKGRQTAYLYPERRAAFVEDRLWAGDIQEFTFELDVPAIIDQGCMFVPLRFVADLFGQELSWEAESRTVTLAGIGRGREAGREAVDRWLGAVVTVKAGNTEATGFVVSGGVHRQFQVITCAHVVWNTRDITVTTPDGRLYGAELRMDYTRQPVKVDLARLRVSYGADAIRSVPRALIDHSDPVELGGRVYAAFGPAAGAAGPVGEGVVSGIHQAELDGSRFEVYEITAPAEPGASGSPVFNEAGRVIGVLFAGVLEGGAPASFIVPSFYL